MSESVNPPKHYNAPHGTEEVQMGRMCRKCGSRHTAADVIETAPGSVLTLFHAAYAGSPRRIVATTAERDMCVWRRTQRDLKELS